MTTTTEPATASGRPAQLPSLITHYIDGQRVPSAGGETFEVLSPATNEVYCTGAAGQASDIGQAVAAAERAFHGPWSRLTARARASMLMRFADAIEARDDRLAELEAFDTGLPITQAHGQARRAAENFRFFADVIVGLNEDAFGVPGQQVNYVTRRPVGVAGLITPWNTPFMLESWKLAPALAAGCTVVLKPAEWSPLSASLLPDIAEEAGLPPGVLNVVHGIGEQAGDALVKHPGVPLISFTGETTTGQLIARNSADHLKGLSMELGGKSPCVIFQDADLDAALDSAIFQIFSLNGERCTAGSRLLVQRGVYEQVLTRLAQRAAAVRVGSPADASTELGALIHPEHYDRVLDYVRIGQQEGARLLVGGDRPAHLPIGNFLSATVFSDVTPEMRIFQEEIFGPVLCVTPFDTEEEAVELANATRYGLAAYIWTADLTRAHRVAASIDSGMLWINSHNVRDLRTPFGGVKASGLGREGGRHSIDFYTESRIVHVSIGSVHVPRFGIGDEVAS
ncbi:MAG: 5-carboxymethyl-2-hydroxymuconate semialdehyde dehydrogenase [Actinomycetota bacterium]|nr:5-carboxymethyl-2-hydroxymuconate semialdehyde dehydrogenase [Actinomycetota bacterium]MDQ2955770.1 5-carboxymethyl-2-hydroxymuconate semialdehyde dehydrogenase [Actinomycetota bacterium]